MSTYRENLYKFPLSLSAHLIDPDLHLDDLAAIEKACFPKLMQEERQDFAELLNYELSMGLMLYEEHKPIGYTIGMHIDEDNSAKALAEDPFIRENQDRIFYLCSTAILKEHRSVLALDFLIHEMGALLKSVNYEYMVSHLRKKYGLSRVMKSRFHAKVLFTDENWEDTGEAFDYSIIRLDDTPFLPTPIDFTFNALRVVRRKIKGIKIPS